MKMSEKKNKIIKGIVIEKLGRKLPSLKVVSLRLHENMIAKIKISFSSSDGYFACPQSFTILGIETINGITAINGEINIRKLLQT